ncbi:uncharacterized protein GGS22DRAFT_42151 [Annulohypoxylon maeteangense]|uniref:uncharacterized protein n=1 Tax=Annulohypoxylon maeteangense TaxID=1927788 RepID=UPI0020078402|nr:uncharacterized protein GGS22DRAFT_42151 [Annulohypoxylon maeteangense]KAI0882893.1 hypothetical protein GGS22DRAFT_42151 [Annulohypoxylon maeteangense]
MTSRFVSGGIIPGDGQTILKPDAQDSIPLTATAATLAKPVAKTETTQWGRESEKEPEKKNIEWEAVQRDLDADRKRREEARRAQVEGGAGGERSLFDVLQANKAAKQAAFEEQNRIRNQFRALDDDEIEFLEGVQDERREEEERIKRETEERLARFRKAQKKSASGPTDDDDDDVGEGVVKSGGNEDGGVSVDDPVSWGAAGKKRKRDKESKSIVKGVKKRASVYEKSVEVPSAAVAAVEKKPVTDFEPKSSTTADKTKPPAPKAAPVITKPSLGLVDYGSDDDDD